jgi:hypothetical protein
MQIPRHEPHLIALVDSPLAALMHQVVVVDVPLGLFSPKIRLLAFCYNNLLNTTGAGIIAQASLARVR